MKLKNREMQFELPSDLHEKLIQFRRKVWVIKSAEAIFALVALTAACFLAIFLADRLGETPTWFRCVVWLTTVLGLFVALPIKLYRWVWQRRQFSQLARLLAWDQPRIGDRLLGVVDLVQNRQDQHASPALCRAAIQQVADDTRDNDFQRSVPQPRHKFWGVVAGLVALVSLMALATPGAGWNALQRWLRPLSDIPRYTFTQLEDTPTEQIVAIGEPFEVVVQLADSTRWNPTAGEATYGKQTPVVGNLDDGRYRFELPAQTESAQLRLAIGDARHVIDVHPKTRPELKSLMADIQLPNYLGHSDHQRDVRSGSVSVVKGSKARFEAVASRPLATASVNGQVNHVRVDGAKIVTNDVPVDEVATQEFRWTDVEGLSSKSPFKLSIRAIDDMPPTVQCDQLSTDRVILDEETLAFQVTASDDFGVKSVGVEWAGVADPRRNPDPQTGEYVLSGGSQETDSLAVAGTFSPKAMGVEPQPIHLRVYTEDYLPGRERVYSPVYRLYVLNREQHMIWVTQQLEKWERQALEVRDEEQRLLDTNRELLALDPSELDTDAARQRIARQAAAERANAQRLAALTMAGEQLIGEAARNPEFNVETLEKWAQVMQTLKQLAKNDMPSVANGLASAANAAKSLNSKPPTAPSVSDSVRGAAQDPDDNDENQSSNQPSKGGDNPLGLVQTTLPGGKKPPGKQDGQSSTPAADDLDQAVEEQQALLAEFNRVMDELKQILQDLQGSTFVKRLKAAADSELKIASTMHDRLQTQFGVDSNALNDEDRSLIGRLYVNQSDTARDVRLIQEDLSAYFERTRRDNFKEVRDEMKETSVVSNFKDMTRLLSSNHGGDTIAQAEFWADKLDRWAEMLVGPACASGGT